MSRGSDFFGLIKMTWTSDAGDNITREFYFREKNLPSINDHSTYNYAQIYFEQNDLEVVSSDAPDLSGKTVRMDRVLTAYKTQFQGGVQAVVPSALISVEPVKDRSIPGWLLNSYD